MHDQAAGEVLHAECLQPAAAPHPVGHRRVDEYRPKGAEHDHRRELDPLHEGADDQRRRDDGEGHLEHEENGLGDIAAKRVHADAGKEGFPETAYPGIGRTAVTEGKAVGDDQPQHRNETADRETLHQGREHVARAYQATVKQRQTRHRHEQHQRGGGQNPGAVPGVDLRRRAALGQGFGPGNRGHESNGANQDGEISQVRHFLLIKPPHRPLLS